MNAVEKILENISPYIYNTIGSSTIYNLRLIGEALDEIEAVACGETQIECDGAYNDSDGLHWVYKRIKGLTCN